MSKLIIFIGLYVISYRLVAQETDILIDPRDGQQYGTVKLGNQWWMAENLKYIPDDGSRCYDDSQANCDDCGLLYTYDAAREACPSGWHLPSDEDWKKLDLFVGVPEGSLNLIGERDSPDTTCLFLSTEGTSGFNGKKCGAYILEEQLYALYSEYGIFITSTELDNETFWVRDLYPNNTQYVRSWAKKDIWVISVRCVSDMGSFFVIDPMPDQAVELGASVNIAIPNSLFYNEQAGDLSITLFGVESQDSYLGPEVDNHVALPEGLTFDPSDNAIRGELLESGIYPIKIIAENGDGDITSDIFTIRAQEILKIDQIDDNELTIFPNPAQGVIHISVPKLSEKNISYEIDNIMGRPIKMGILTENSISVENLKSGLYLLHLNINGQTITKKILIE